MLEISDKMNYTQSEGAQILIVDDVHPLLWESLALHGLKCDYFPDIDSKNALALLPAYRGLVIRSKFKLGADILKQAGRLEFIARAGAGMDNIDEAAAAEASIVCFNAPEGNRDALGEHTLGMLLSLTNHLNQGDRQIRQGIWDRSGNRGIEIKNRCVGLIGYGFMGSSFATKLSGLGCRILAHDTGKKGFGTALVEESDLDTLFREADVLSLHIPLTPVTRGMVNRDFLSHFLKPIILLNTSRGEVVVTHDLVQMLHSGKVAAAGLDVLENEKFPLDESARAWFDELAAMPQVLMSPHVAGWSVESYERISQVLAEKILEWYNKK